MGAAPTYDQVGGSLPAVLADHGRSLDGAVALLSSPRRFAVGRLAGDRVVDRTGSPLELDDVFEARLFIPDRELRWLRRGDGGDGTVVAELDDGRWLDPIDQTYLVWGASAGDQADGWTTLSTARGASLTVPVATSGRARLVAREYVRVDEHGNARVADQRLLRLEEAR